MGWSCWKVSDPQKSSGNSTQKASKSQELQAGNATASLPWSYKSFPCLDGGRLYKRPRLGPKTTD